MNVYYVMIHACQQQIEDNTDYNYRMQNEQGR